MSIIDPRTPIRLAVVATPRSGTAYLAELLDAAGVPAVHEGSRAELGRPLELAQGAAADVSWLLAPHIPELRRRGVEVVLLSRHPLLVLASMWRLAFLASRLRRGLFGVVDSYARAHAPEAAAVRRPRTKTTSSAGGGQEAAVRFWLAWNRRALASGLDAFRVQDIGAQELQALADLAGAGELDGPRVARALAKTSRTSNTVGGGRPPAGWSPSRLTWDELRAEVGAELAGEVADLAAELGHPAEAPARPAD